jgi:hypothetical protein
MGDLPLLYAAGFVCLGVVLTLGCVYLGASLAWRFQGREGSLSIPKEPKDAKAAKLEQLPEDTE